jgi:putative ABC transport system ATP-binding protein
MEECALAGTTLVFVSHDAALGHLFDRCLSLSDINQADMEPRAA